MKIAVMLIGDKISPHFGGSEKVCIYTVENGAIVKKEYFDMPEHKAGLFAKFIKQKEADVVIAGSMGERARYIFDSLGIRYFIGVLGSPDEAVEKLLKGELKSDEMLAREIHDHEEGLHRHRHGHSTPS
ncbi:Dinitrogenase iron-molybdenum cofactor biosynthesis protein [Caldicellulosiruptor saccharolyticus DSM 8903]|uniref:Dinitrogenase iron-molybdenum cofactor biosynthesis protein n=1 Tax=Caldicellulosiruptor saccharolyticus (strain ATCC 43494 / DSM 8903 / Tp8T 6331) TaxID=351627 RepID=A4XG36_CALS8|nr:NifB/NifX family molybdenum-iron cluster-binding protein [Caldicellulosiruptor saccharolyticus]ABP65871.1 Dinitrogenase iron-molybdenum cofactor biosynthesis protein [Caldicellulosiruptor saccharolyticus DSM 8903]